MVKTYTLKTVPQLKAIQWKGDNFEEVREFLGDRYIEAKELFPRDRLTPERLDFLIHKAYKGCCDDKSRYQIIFSNILGIQSKICNIVLYYITEIGCIE